MSAIAKVTSKRQLTLPKEALEAVGSPTHFRVQWADNKLILTPAVLTGFDDAAASLEGVGITRDVLREARRLVRTAAGKANGKP